MKPIKFPEHNTVFAEDQPEYTPLPAYKDPGPAGNVISCWELSIIERLRLLITGKLWVNLMMFHQPLTPSFFSTKKSDVLIVPLKWWQLNIGTKSILFGAHCFFLHPFFVFAAWWKLYGFPWDPRLWVAFFVHDLGYLGKPNMDGQEGEQHPYLGARIMHWLFDYKKNGVPTFRWLDFTFYHSRFMAKKHSTQYSRLCVADKLSFIITPAWLYLPMVRLTGEISEYMRMATVNNDGNVPVQENQLIWFYAVKVYMQKWVDEHKDLKDDTWTNPHRPPVDRNGVY